MESLGRAINEVEPLTTIVPSQTLVPIQCESTDARQADHSPSLSSPDDRQCLMTHGKTTVVLAEVSDTTIVVSERP